jgi:MFS superfamily sulfate permease-like transporter
MQMNAGPHPRARRDAVGQSHPPQSVHTNVRRRTDSGAQSKGGSPSVVKRAGVPVLGALPQGLPGLSLPLIRSSDIVPVVLGGLAVAIVSFADTSVLSRTYAACAGAAPDPNQEMLALGAANVAAGLFQGIPVSASASRTLVAQAAGAKTQLAGVVGALAVAALLMWAPNLLATLPTAALAAVVISAAAALFEITDLRRIYRIQRWEFWLAMGRWAGVAVLGAIPGIDLAILIAVIEFLGAGWRPHTAVLGRVDGLKGYHDITRYPAARIVPGLVLFRWNAPLFFANAEWFRDRVLAAVEAAPTAARWLVVSAEPMTSVDVTAADVLDALDATLHEAGIALCFAEMKDPVKGKLKRFGLFTRLGEQRFFATLGEAVNRYVEAQSVDWVDWEERAK